MRVTVIGCSGSGPGRDGAASCYLIQAGGTSIVLDAGPGSFAVLGRHVDPAAVDAVLLSHLHPDHCLDLCAWNVAARWGDTGRLDPLPVHGPVGTRERLERAYGVAGPEPLVALAFGDIETLTAVGDITVRVTRANHPPPAYAIRLDHSGSSLVYTGDTGPSDDVTALAEGADLLVAEASSTVDGSGMHLSGREAGDLACRAGVGRLLLTHIPSWTDPEAQLRAAEDAFGGPVERAVEGRALEVRAP